MATVAEYLAEELAAAGVTRVYGLPGGENVEALDAMRRQGIEFLLVKNESSACYMAATEARLTGGTGVALTTLGPGAANAYAGLAHAFLDRAPILLITAAADPAAAGRHTHQVLDLHAAFEPICKYTVELSPGNAIGAISGAIRLARSNRPGPVHISVHNRIASQQVGARSERYETPSESGNPAGDLQKARAMLADKRRPIIILGLGLEPDAPYPQVKKLAEALGAPVIDSPKSKGALSADHPLYAGTIGLTRQDPVYQLLDEADCMVAIGFDVVELVKPWDYQKPLIWIANWANRDPRIASELELLGDIKDILDALSDVKSAAGGDWGGTRVRRFHDKPAAGELPTPRANRILPQSFLNSLRAHTPDDIIITTDVGSHKILAALRWQARRPNRYLVSNGLSAMGFGLSSAMAAAEITGQPTACITGDAGIAMVLGELGLLVERRLPVLVAVMNDGALDLIRSAQNRQDRQAFGTEFFNPEFEFIARAYGLPYYKVESERDCDRAIRDALADRGPALLDVMIDPIGYPTTVVESHGS
ncbi:MAG: thiamine pyrophosphate-binding protein [Chloroflexi bacterium]|nr:thiamine pyrophosphate-binding protein [Chloroflexota bacterium]